MGVERILLIGDAHNYLKKGLEGRGYNVDYDPDGTEGLKILQDPTKEPGFVVLDNPLYTTYQEFVKEVRKISRFRGLPVGIVLQANELTQTFPDKKTYALPEKIDRICRIIEEHYHAC